MRLRLRVLLFSLLFTFITCHRDSRLISKAIIGHWGNRNLSIEYTADGHYNMILDGKPLVYYNTGQLKYKLDCSPENAYCWTVLYGSKESEETREKIMIEDDVLFSISYKSFEGIKHHIDQIGYYKKCPDNSPCTFDTIPLKASNSKITKYFIPSGLRGGFYVAYGESETAPIPVDAQGNRLIKVPSNRLFVNSDEARPLQFAKKLFEFFQMGSTDQDAVPVNYINYHDLYVLERDSNLWADYDMDSLYVLPLGYNQMARSSLHERIDRRVSGNVEFFRINTLRNLILWLNRGG